MNAPCTIALCGLALILTSCSFTQQKAGSSEVASPEAGPAVEIAGNPFSTRSRRVKPQAEESQKDKPAEEAAAAPASDAPELTAEAPAEAPADAQLPAPESPQAAPTEAQQEAALQLLSENTHPAATPQPTAAEESSPEQAPAESVYYPAGRALRLGSIAPQEDPASATDAPPPPANTVDMHGLRSPKLPTTLPMNINGKLNSTR